MSQGTIYMIINKVTGCKYIGQTTESTNKKWKEHIDQSKRMSNKPLHKAMRKHGNHNFLIKVLCECNITELDEKEKFYIKEYNTLDSDKGYNGNDTEEEILPKEEEKKKDENKKWGFQLKENRGNGKHMATKIIGINVDTGEEVLWDSISEAAIELTGDKKNTGNISNAANKGWKAYGYLWKKAEKSKHSIPVFGVHKKTWIRTPTYKSIKEAARQFGSDNDMEIRISIKNPRRRSWKGYYWFKD